MNTEHPHHWLIDTPSGPLAEGRCKSCGKTRQFRNWSGDMDYLETYRFREEVHGLSRQKDVYR